MRKLSLIVVALAALALAPAALACALCDGERCDWGVGPDYWAADCWFEWCPPCGCYTTGHCPPGFAAQNTTDLAMEYRIASVEIHQGGVLVARRTEEAPTAVAEQKQVRRSR